MWSCFCPSKRYTGACLEVQRLRLGALTVGSWVQSLVRELRSHMLCGMAKIKKKRAVRMSGAVIISSANVMEYLPCTRHSIGSRGQEWPKPLSSLSLHANRSWPRSPRLTALSALDCFLGSHHQPVLPNPPPVVLLRPAPHHRLLLYAAGISLDQVSSLRLTPEGGGLWSPSLPAWWAPSRAFPGNTWGVWGTARAHVWLPAGQERTGSWWPRSTYSWSSWCWSCPPLASPGTHYHLLL